jgi:TonB family protein
LIEADCGIDGRLTNLTIVRSADRVLDAAALNAVRRYKRNPRQRNGQPEVSRLPGWSASG